MLRELHVRNLAVLAEASVELAGGLNVLTGETGAGKSIVVDSLTLLAGSRAVGELIRTGAETLTVSGVFAPAGDGWRAALAAAGVEVEGDELLVRREISRAGRNRVFVNDQPTTLRLLSDLAPWLLRIYGQREELGLLDPDLQRTWLDASGGEEAAKLLASTAGRHAAWRRLAERLDRLAGDARARRERVELLRFQVSELTAAEPVAGEETALREERDVLRHAEAILAALGGANELLYEDDGAAVDRLAQSAELLAGVAEWEPTAAAAVTEIEELRVRLEETARDLRRRLDGFEAEPGRLDEVEGRLAALERLFRKYAVESAEELLAHRRRAAAELAEIEQDVGDREALERQVAAALADYERAAGELSAARRRWGAALVAAIGQELGDLGLGKARLEFALERRPTEAGPHGFDQVALLFSPNPGEEPRPLSLIASGGELSRIYLALQLAVLARGGEGGGAPAPTLVFDEVDSGVGGAQAAALGRKLQRLGGGHQILVVTHLPQVASYGDHHFRVAKEVRGERTFTRVEALDDERRAEEVARMLAGERTTDLSLSHARELIDDAAARRGAAETVP